jgi:hypothetical protein
VGERGSSDLPAPRFAEYWVAIAIDDEARLLDAATGADCDRRVAGVLVGEANEYGSLLALQIRTEHTDEPMGQPFQEAKDAYEELRDHAGVDREARTQGMTTTVHLRWLGVGSLAGLAARPPPPATRRPASLPHDYLLKARHLHALGGTDKATSVPSMTAAILTMTRLDHIAAPLGCIASTRSLRVTEPANLPEAPVRAPF